VLPTTLYFIPSAMTGFIVNVFPFLNRVSHQEAFEGLELGEGKPSRPVLRGPGGRKAAWLLGINAPGRTPVDAGRKSGSGPLRCWRDLSVAHVPQAGFWTMYLTEQ